MVDRKAEREASDAENTSFLTDAAVQNDNEFDLDIEDLNERTSGEQTDDTANREHQDGENSDDDAAANVSDAELDGLSSTDGETPAGELKAKEPVLPIASPEAPGTTAPAGAIPAVEDTPAATPAPTEVKPTGEQIAPAPVPSAEAPGEAKPPSEQDIQQTYQQWRGQSEELLATHYYGLSPEVTAELELEPAKVIPRLMAKVYLDAMTASIGQMTMHFPRLVRLVNQQMTKEDESEGAFFKAWPQLKGKEDEIRRFGQAWRNLNPSASAEQFVNEVGAGVMVALRLDPTPRASQPEPGRTPAFVPGIGAPPRNSGRSPNGDNPFTNFNQEFEEDVDDDFS